LTYSSKYVFKDVIFELTQGWRLVSPHFTTLLESAIFPALVMNEKVRIYFLKVTGMDFFFSFSRDLFSLISYENAICRTCQSGKKMLMSIYGRIFLQI
jgi:hypothetical protein